MRKFSPILTLALVAILTGCNLRLPSLPLPKEKPFAPPTGGVVDTSRPKYTDWMNTAQLDAYLLPLEAKGEDGKNFFDKRHWIDGLKTRFNKKKRQSEWQIRIVDAPQEGQYWWYWWINQSKASFLEKNAQLVKQNFVLVSSSTFTRGDGTTAYNGVWHRIGALGEGNKKQ